MELPLEYRVETECTVMLTISDISSRVIYPSILLWHRWQCLAIVYRRLSAIWSFLGKLSEYVLPIDVEMYVIFGAWSAFVCYKGIRRTDIEAHALLFSLCHGPSMAPDLDRNLTHHAVTVIRRSCA